MLDLAVNCKLLTADEERQVLPGMLDFFKKNQKESIGRYLVTHKILSKDNIQFLYSVKSHLDLLMADRKFGRLGVANNFVAPEKVQKALDMQVEIFKTRKKSIKIGDILVQNNDISVADKTALLLTQDRIKDELLADALNAIAKSEMEQLEMNKRFGAIAVKKQLISTDQLNQALKRQKQEVEKGSEKRILAEIFKELFDLSDKDIMSVLKVQKKLETKRMNLEKNLKAYNLEKTSNRELDTYFEYHVTDDKLKAIVTKTQKTDSTISTSDFLNWFSLSGIKYGLCNKDQIETFLNHEGDHTQLEIASGKAPVPFQKEKIEFHFDVQAMGNDEADAGADLPTVKKDDVLATITPHEDAVPGTDVFGRPIHLPEEPVTFLGAGQGVAKQQTQFIALMPGHPQVFKDRTLFITPSLEGVQTQDIDGDITDEDHTDYPACNLNVKGNIVPGIHVACHDLTIQGDIMGNVTATGNIDISGNIGQGNLDSIDEKQHCKVEAAGHIRISHKIINANIIAKQGLNAPNSDLVASKVFACGDVVLNNIFSSRQAPSILKVTRENLIAIEKISKKIESLNAGLAKLTHKVELENLSKELMEQIQVQNGYLEKQNVTIFLNRMLNSPEVQTQGPKSIEEKYNIFKSLADEDNQDPIVIPEHTKAHRFMTIVMDKINPLNENDQKLYVKELYENISGMYKTAVKVTERINKKYEARSKMIDKQVEQSKSNIQKIEDKIDEFQHKKDLIMHGTDQSKMNIKPVIKVKNQAGKQTIILGETAKMVIDKSIYRVSLTETFDEKRNKAIIKVDGFYD